MPAAKVYRVAPPKGRPATEEAAWPTARAILDYHEDGASGHCLRRLDNGWHHHRLNITVLWGD